MSKQTKIGWNGWVDIYKPNFREAIKSDRDVENAAAKTKKDEGNDSAASVLNSIKEAVTFDDRNSNLQQRPLIARIIKNPQGGIDTVGRENLHKDTSK